MEGARLEGVLAEGTDLCPAVGTRLEGARAEGTAFPRVEGARREGVLAEGTDLCPAVGTRLEGARAEGTAFPLTEGARLEGVPIVVLPAPERVAGVVDPGWVRDVGRPAAAGVRPPLLDPPNRSDGREGAGAGVPPAAVGLGARAVGTAALPGVLPGLLPLAPGSATPLAGAPGLVTGAAGEP